MSDLLREYIRALLSEASANVASHVADKIGAKIIHTGDDLDGFVGEGSYSAVYEVDWNGKHAVMKLVSFDNDPQELEASKKIKELKDNVPQEIGKHLPNIYFVDKITVRPLGFSTDFNYSVTVMEYLYELPKGIRDITFYRNKENNLTNAVKQSLKLFQQSKSKGEFVNRATELLMGFVDKGKERRVADEIFKNLSMWIKNPHFDVSDLYDEEFFTLKKMVNPAFAAFGKKPDDRILHGLAEILKDYFPNIRKFPDSPTYDDGGDFADPRLQDLYDAIKWLDDKENVCWDDLTYDNIRMRKSDGTFVISDYGSFEFY